MDTLDIHEQHSSCMHTLGVNVRIRTLFYHLVAAMFAKTSPDTSILSDQFLIDLDCIWKRCCDFVSTANVDEWDKEYDKSDLYWRHELLRQVNCVRDSLGVIDASSKTIAGFFHPYPIPTLERHCTHNGIVSFRARHTVGSIEKKSVTLDVMYDAIKPVFQEQHKSKECDVQCFVLTAGVVEDLTLKEDDLFPDFQTLILRHNKDTEGENSWMYAIVDGSVASARDGQARMHYLKHLIDKNKSFPVGVEFLGPMVMYYLGFEALWDTVREVRYILIHLY